MVSMTQRMPTLFLMADSSMLFGAARVIDLFGQFDQYNLSRTGEEADARALMADWTVVGDDFLESIATARRMIEDADAQQLELALSDR
jgi:hypothetical protein